VTRFSGINSIQGCIRFDCRQSWRRVPPLPPSLAVRGAHQRERHRELRPARPGHHSEPGRSDLPPRPGRQAMWYRHGYGPGTAALIDVIGTEKLEREREMAKAQPIEGQGGVSSSLCWAGPTSCLQLRI
jgi:hypothetical protein